MVSKNNSWTLLMITLFLLAFNNCSSQNGVEPWKANQLMPPAELAKILNDSGSIKPFLFSIGFGAGIKNSIVIGPTKEKENLDKFKKELSKLPKDATIIIYCGCCPFKNCPNVRPAFQLLNELKFTNAKLLNLEKNLKTDWIDKGFPVE